MNTKLAVVLSGGGARGALQVGAMYALAESGLQPDLVMGTSIGAINAAFVALNGFSKDSLAHLADFWRQAANADLLPANYVWLTVRAMFGRSSHDPSERIREFLITGGLSPEARFEDFKQPLLRIVSSDLYRGQPVIHGEAGDENVLEALLLSTALPPWAFPVRKYDRYLMDGGVVSNLPVEPAVQAGASEIIALDLVDARPAPADADGLSGFLDRLIFAVEKRQADLELELARMRGIPILYLPLKGKPAVALWDFTHTNELIVQGYEIARRVMDEESNPLPLLKLRVQA